MILKRIGLLLLVFFCWTYEGSAENRTETTDFQLWVKQFRNEAASQGISSATLETVLQQVQFLEWVVEADRNQPEFRKSLDSYLTGMLSEKRIAKGRQKLAENRQLLQKIAKKYAVQPRFIVALWGIETYYGQHTGKVPIIDALATLAYDGRRGRYFRRELLNALKIIDAGHVSYAQMKGSWAGAMGQVQFMPSSFLRYAVDGNADGRIDLWNTPQDYLSSAANYLAKMGWQGNVGWGHEVRVPSDFDEQWLGNDQQASLTSLRKLGVRLLSGAELPQESLRGELLKPAKESGRVFLVYENYHALLKWNRAHSFAIAVGMLADRLAEEGQQ